MGKPADSTEKKEEEKPAEDETPPQPEKVGSFCSDTETRSHHQTDAPITDALKVAQIKHRPFFLTK